MAISIDSEKPFATNILSCLKTLNKLGIKVNNFHTTRVIYEKLNINIEVTNFKTMTYL
jgi:hypothetical protein